jgi:hypothetical protein
MKRRPLFLLSLAIVAAALLQAMFAPASPSDEPPSDRPDGIVCSACGPIPTGFAPRPTWPLDAGR